MIDLKSLSPKLGSYSLGNSNSLTDSTLLPRVQAYRRQVGGRIQAMDKATMEKKLPEGGYLVSKKIDGEFNVLCFDGTTAFLLNPGGTVRVGLPLLEEASELLKKAKIKSAIIPGELYVIQEDDKRERVHEVSRIARNPDDAKALETLQFAIFDIMELDGTPHAELAENYAGVFDLVTKHFSKGQKIHPIPTESVDSCNDVTDYFEKWVEKTGGEGIVARSENLGSYKIKPRHTIDAVVVGFAESIDDRAGMLHDLLIAVIRQDGSYHLIGHVGGGFTDDQRKTFLSDLEDLVVESEYAEVNKDRVAYRMVKPEWVIEISCLDLISQNTRGASIDKMALTWDDKNSTWETIRRLPIVSIISPQFVRIREDKQANAHDVRISQLSDIVEIDKIDKAAKDLILPKSTLIKREVVTKTLKEKTMVRKLILWKTNKEEHDESYPAYVCHLTDFSPNRKDPMKREIRVSNSETQIQEFYDQLKTKNFVKGWKEPE